MFASSRAIGIAVGFVLDTLLADPNTPDDRVAATVKDLGDRGFASDGLEFDDRGRLYLTDYEHNAVLRRGADGSLILSTDHWRLEETTAEAFHFAAREHGAPPLEVRFEDVERLTWDRLPKQQVRSQIRFVLVNGDLWTFSGTVDESALPER